MNRTVETAVVMMAVALSVVLVACGRQDGSAVPAAISSSDASPEPAACPRMGVDDYRKAEEKALTAVLEDLTFPAGTCFFAVRVTETNTFEGAIAVSVDLTAENYRGPDDLRPYATDVAHVLKRSAIAERIAELTVTNWGLTAPDYRNVLIDRDFQSRSWDGSPSREAEMASWSVLQVS
ncbi:hypothetical protein [Nocardia farcinica]|uniref:hypothetical protein n=1 Tax=Nocardia farcinica TaxID=37329 RepID=UPI0012FEB76D|nr:hypothetical protein [Nocardia farcinica]